jgi:Spy/CpxP family protein refolding chaperone
VSGLGFTRIKEKTMRYWKFTMISAASLILVIAMATTAGAQQGVRARAQLRNRIDQMLDYQGFVRGLQLTDTQKEDIKAILKARQPDILAAREALLRARIKLASEDPTGPQDFGAAQAGIAGLSLDILKQIKTKLTPEQLTTVQNREQKRADLLQKALDRLLVRGQN